MSVGKLVQVSAGMLLAAIISAGMLATAHLGDTNATASASSCPHSITGTTPSAAGVAFASGVSGTTTEDLALFAQQFNALRLANCLAPVPLANFRHSVCMEQRLVWMAEDPSTDPTDAWGHIGSQRSDGLPSVGCDGNLAGGSGTTGATAATKWWDSPAHREALFHPEHIGSTAQVCIDFAMTHGGVPNETAGFTRASARWTSCESDNVDTQELGPKI